MNEERRTNLRTGRTHTHIVSFISTDSLWCHVKVQCAGTRGLRCRSRWCGDTTPRPRPRPRPMRRTAATAAASTTSTSSRGSSWTTWSVEGEPGTVETARKSRWYRLPICQCSDIDRLCHFCWFVIITVININVLMFLLLKSRALSSNEKWQYFCKHANQQLCDHKNGTQCICVRIICGKKCFL